MYESWKELNGAIKEGMDLRRYELVTLAAALALRSSYCSLAHGQLLSEQYDEPVAAIVKHRSGSGLSDADIAAMELAERIVTDATEVSAQRRRLNELGVSDHEVEMIVLAAAARCFFSKSLDALGALPNSSYRTIDTELRELLTVGVPIDEP